MEYCGVKQASILSHAYALKATPDRGWIIKLPASEDIRLNDTAALKKEWEGAYAIHWYAWQAILNEYKDKD